MIKTVQRAKSDTMSKAATPDLAAYSAAATDPLFAVAEKCLENGAGKVFVVDPDRRLLGEVSLGAIRATVLSGDYRHVSVIGTLVSPCERVVRPGDNERPTQDVLTPEVDANGRLVAVRVNQNAAFLPVAEPDLGPAEFRNLMDAFLSTWISSTGDYIRTFEKNFANACDMTQGVATSNGTVSLHLALVALGVGPGDEVIVPDFTFAASANVVIHLGATPVLVDVDPVTWCISPEIFEKAITPRTKVVMPVHVFGRPAPMTEICEIARRHNIHVLEDCAEAHGARYDGRVVGSFSEVSSFSFFANKIITTGEGGICLTNNEKLAARMRMLRDHGMKPERRYWHEEAGFNYRMTNMQAAVGVAQLDRMGDFLAMRGGVHQRYVERMSDIPGVEFPPPLPERFTPVTWFSCARVPAAKRPALIEACKKQNIDLRPFFNGLSSMPAYTRWAAPCPVSYELSQTGVNLPTSRRVDDAMADTIADIFRATLTA